MICHPTPATGEAAARTHPLDPLSAAEIEQAPSPPPAPTAGWASAPGSGARPRRGPRAPGRRGPEPAGEVKVAWWRWTTRRAAWEIDVLLGAEPRCLDWRSVDPRRPGITSDEARAAAQACRESPLFRAALAKRGIHDVSLVMIDAESMGGFEPEKYRAAGVTWGTVWHRTTEGDNGYARPVQGVVPIIDMHTMEVLEVEDHGVVPVSEEAGPLERGAWGPDRAGLEPLDVVQKEGPSFTVDGWRVRLAGLEPPGRLHPPRGPGPLRPRVPRPPVLKRAACNEMYVPYLDSNSTQYRKNFFDWGEYGAGPLTNSLALGCDCLGVIRYFDATCLGGDGDPVVIPQAICMHEEDAGILWKHNDLRRGVSEVRRSRRLIISNFQTVANYDYGFYWSLYQDGRIELEVKLTGILSASGIEEGEEVPYGRVVSQQRADADPPALLRPAPGHRDRRRAQPAGRGARRGRAGPAPQPVRQRGAQRADARCQGVAGGPADRPGDARHWRVESADRQPVRRTDRVPPADPEHRPLVRPARLGDGPPGALHPPAPVGHPVRPGREVRRRPVPEPRRARRGRRARLAAPGPLDRRRPSWCSGPCSACTTCPGPSSGRSCRSSRSTGLEPDGFFDRNPALDIPDPAAGPATGSTCCHRG
jgi:primary-amine oxidase